MAIEAHKVNRGLTRSLASIVLRAWMQPDYRLGLLLRDLNSYSLLEAGLLVDSDASVKIVANDANTINFVLACEMTNELVAKSAIWFEPTAFDTNMELRYFSPIRLPEAFVSTVLMRIPNGSDGPHSIERNELNISLNEFGCSLGEVRNLVIWKNTENRIHLVIPTPPVDPEPGSYNKLLMTGDWLQLATFANIAKGIDVT